MSNDRDLDSVDVIQGLIRVSSHLSAPTSLAVRMKQLCKETAAILKCDRCSIMLWNGQRFQGVHNWGNPPDIAVLFPNYRVSLDAPILQSVFNSEQCYAVVNDARENPTSAKIAKLAGIVSIVVAGFRAPDQTPLGFLTVEFNERMGSFDKQRAEIALGAARLAQAAIVTDQERRSRKRLATELSGAIDGERRRFARDLHDEPLQRLFALNLRLKVIREQTTDPKTRDALTALAGDCAEATARIRQIVIDAHPETVTNYGLADSLRALAEQHAGHAECHLTTEAAKDTRHSAATVACLLKIAEQALINLQQHANATSVTITVQSLQDRVRVEIADDGTGFDPCDVQPGRLGIVSMRERAQDLNGTVEIESSAKTGTTVRIELPDPN